MPTCHCTLCKRARVARDFADVALLDAIIAEVALTYHLTRPRLLSKRRTSHIALARQIGFYLSREMTHLTLHTIGDLWMKDHSTIVHGHQAIARRITASPQFGQGVAELRRSIEGATRQMAT